MRLKVLTSISIVNSVLEDSHKDRIYSLSSDNKESKG